MAADTKADAQPNELRGTLPAGARLRNYELISVLGHGGFGITYYARDTTLGREVAVKEYLPTSLALRENGTTVVPRSTQLAEDFIWGRERFLEEARILATLEGVPSIVRVYDFLEANGTAYMIMGLARGETLEQRLKRDKQLPAVIIERLLDRLLGGLEEVHKAGFLHRDVKPANIILDAKDNPTLIDFGASRAAMADRTAALTAIFTPRYAAAEQLTSDKQGPWTDIYSLSATLYHAITGRPPPSSLERALNDSYEPLSGLSLAGFSPGTLQRIDAGLALRAKDRPQSIALWRDGPSSTEAPDGDGDATVVGARVKRSPVPETPARPAPPAARPAPPPARAEPSPPAVAAGKKNRIMLLAAAAAAVLVLAVGGYLVFAPGSAPPPAPFGDQKAADARAAAAKAQADRQRADDEAAKQKAAAEARQKAAAEAQQKAAAEASRRQRPSSRRQRPRRSRRQPPRRSRRQRPRRSRRQRPRRSRRQRLKRSRRQRPRPSRRRRPRSSRRPRLKPSRKRRPRRSRRRPLKPSRRQRLKPSGRRRPKLSRRQRPKPSKRRRLKPSRRRRPRRSRRRRPKPSRRQRPKPSRRRRLRPSSKRKPRPRLKSRRRLPRRRCDWLLPTASGSRWR